MDNFTLGIIFLTLSAIVHASWNFIAKKSQQSSKEFFFIANSAGIILFIPILFFIPWHLVIFPRMVWILICVVGIFESIYFTTLPNAYQRGELSITYPIMRSFPVIFALLFGVFYYHRVITFYFSVGCIVTVIGTFILSMQHFKDFALKKYINAAACFAYVTALCTAMYMIADNHALANLHLHNSMMNFFVITMLYSLIRYAAVSAGLGISIFHKKQYRDQVKKTWHDNKKSILLTTLGMKLSYTLALLSMLLIHHVVYVILFRQLSVPIAALLGIYFADEKNKSTKWIGIVMMVAGIVLAST